MKIYFPVKYQVLFDLGFPLNSEHCFWALKRTFTGKYFDKISKIEFSLWKTCQISLLAFSFRQKINFMFFQTISDIIFGTIPHFCVKSTNHKYSKISFLQKDKSTLVVYPCVLDLGLWILVSDGRMGSTHTLWVSSKPENCLVRDICGFHGFGGVLRRNGVFQACCTSDVFHNFRKSANILCPRLSARENTSALH